MSKLSRRLTGSFVVMAALLQTSCTTPGGGTGTPPLAIDPTCNILAVSSLKNNTVDTAIVAKRSNDATDIGGFTRFLSLGGPRGNPAIAGNADAYGISEAWFRRPGDATVVRAQSHAASRRGTTDSLASAWSMVAQDPTGKWGAPFAAGSANNGNEVDDSAAGSLTTPQLMTVGDANLQMFACAGARTEDNTGRTTWLIEVFPPNVAASASGRRIAFVQDMLYGDDHFLPNAPGPLIGPAHPPTPNVHGPGDQLRNGHAQCAMTQLNDNVTTRELHMIVVDRGHLYHSMANGFGPSLDDHGDNVGNRFSMISPWADVSTALGANFGNIEGATLVARPTAVSVIFEAENAGRHRLWHAVRFSANGGSWRPADDVTAASGASLTGLVESWNVAAGFCPNFEKTPNAPDELDYITWNNTSTFFGRIVSTPRNWAPGISGIYSPTTRINSIVVFPNDPNRHNVVQTTSLFKRPF